MPDSHIILAGQSNALGYLNNGPAPYTPTARVQIWADTNADGVGDAWNYMLPGHNTGTVANPDVWGPEVEFANRWLADHATGTLWIVKVAKGSTELAENPGTDWSPLSTGEMYATTTTAVNAARAVLADGQYAFSVYDAVLWMQGEQDATDLDASNAYGTNIRAFIASARTDWGFTPFVAARISDSPALPYAMNVRQAVWNLDHGDDPLGGVSTFKTIGFGMQPDHLHYNMAGHLSLGDAFYDAWVL
jgi:hypothetical protein